MPIVTQCPKCQATFNLPDALAGKNAKCARCQNVFRVPDAVGADAPMAEAVDGPGGGGMWAEPVGPPSDPRPRRDRYPSEPPTRSGSGAGWIIALAVGVPLLILLLAGGAVVVFGVVMYFAVASTSGKAVVAQSGQTAIQPGGPGNEPPPDRWNQPPPQPQPAPGPGEAPPAPADPPPPKPRDPPPALKPPVAIDVTPAELPQDKVVKTLPSTIADVAVGGGGRFLILYLPDQNKLAVFDVSTVQVAKYLSFNNEPDLRFAAGMDKLIVALPNSRVMRRYSLKTFEEEQSAPLPINGDVDALCMGSASNGPLWVQAKGDQIFGGAPMLLDPSTLKEWPADWGDQQPPGGGAFLRASDDGQVFTMRNGVGGEPHTVTVVSLLGGRAKVVTQWGVSSSVIVPDADGHTLYTGCAVYNGKLAALFPNPPPQSFCKPFLPGVASPFFARLDYKDWDQLGGDLSFFTAGAQEPFAVLKGVDGVSNEQVAYGGNRDKLTHDQRVHIIPAAKAVVAIPKGNLQLALYRFDPEAALEKSNQDYLVVTSRPPRAAKKGQEYAYSLAVKSKKGGVKYKLESGPKGMAIDAAGKLTWTPPADADAENDVIVSVTDAGGQETFHSFRVGVE
jgi:hypothetical protein